MRVIPSILFSIISYFMMGFTRSAGHFFFFLLTIFISSVFGSAICFFVAATISVFGKISSIERIVTLYNVLAKFR
jgi:ATP-binding cassette subfamily G (WHITE) protein 2